MHPLFSRLNSYSPRSTLLNGDFNEQARSKLALQDFDLLRTIGTGHSSKVHLARHKKSSLVVVLKAIPQSYAKCIRSEKLALKKIRCPFIVKLFGVFEDNLNTYMVEEFVPGGELYQRLDAEISIEEARFYTIEISSALMHLHSRCIIYRDLKPENVLLTQSGHIKLVDFGLSRHLSQDKCFTMCGTQGYLAPEVLLGVCLLYTSDAADE